MDMAKFEKLSSYAGSAFYRERVCKIVPGQIFDANCCNYFSGYMLLQPCRRCLVCRLCVGEARGLGGEMAKSQPVC